MQQPPVRDGRPAGGATPYAARELERKLLSQTGEAIARYGMICEGERVLIGVSGGKDSLTLVRLLALLQRRAPVRFELHAVTLHPGFPGFVPDRIGDWVRSQGVEHDLVRTDIAATIERLDDGRRPACVLCARFRRRILYDHAARGGFTALALAHHADDLVESCLMSQLFLGRLQSMAPRLRSNDGRSLTIRPLCLSPETLIRSYSEALDMPVMYASCPHEQGRDDSQRQAVKELLDRLEQQHPRVRSSILASLGNVRPSHLMDCRLWDFPALRAEPD